jgi:hypothetical protein
MTQSGTLFQLRPLVRRTGATECGLWPTPRVSDIRDGRTLNEDGRRVSPSGLYGANLADAAKMYPTPTTKANQMCLSMMSRGVACRNLRAAMWPTPTVQDASNNGGPSQYHRNSLPLNAVAGGSLNPTWVEWLMGFPLEWTALDALETQLSRRSSKSSGGKSSRTKKK